jgi:hypothetical protein
MSRARGSQASQEVRLMPDEFDIADEFSERFVVMAINRCSQATMRRPDFCDCESWQKGRFCGDSACRDTYERETRARTLHGVT